MLNLLDGPHQLGIQGADGHIHLVPLGQLGHQGLRDGDGNLQPVHPVDDGHRRRGPHIAALRRVQRENGARDGGDHIAPAVHILQRGGQLLHIGFVALHPGLQLGQGSGPLGLSGLEGELRLVNLQLGGGPDLKQGLQVVDVFLRQRDLFVENGLLVLVALQGGVVADAGRAVGGQGAGHVQGTQGLAGGYRIPYLHKEGGALGLGRHKDGLLPVSDHPARHLVFGGDGVGIHLLNLNGHAGGRVRLRAVSALFGLAGGKAQHQGGGQDNRTDFFLLHGAVSFNS